MRASAYCTERDADAQAARWLAELRAGTAPRPQLRFSPEQAALLVIDMLVYFASPEGRCFLPASIPAANRIASLVGAFRRRGSPIVFTRHAHEGAHDLGMLGRFFSDYIRLGEPDSEIVPTLAPAEGEPVVRKTTYDAFLGTPLEALLHENRVSQVVVAGVLTHMCVETTARAAFCRGFEVYVPVDATASVSEARHLGSLASMADAVAVPALAADLVAACG